MISYSNRKQMSLYEREVFDDLINSFYHNAKCISYLYKIVSQKCLTTSGMIIDCS